MSELPASTDRQWRLWSLVVVSAALLFGAALGLVIVPVVQSGGAGIDAFTAICRALGVTPGSPARPTPPSEAAAQPVTTVAWNEKTVAEIYHADAKRGEAIAQEKCVACHTVEGNTPDPTTIPRNAGQSRFAIYKQLHDYKSGARVNATMQPLVAQLDDQAIADLAAFYGALIRGAIDPSRGPFFLPDAKDLVLNGDVARGIPPCAACHGVAAGGPIETPTLTRQYPQYIEAQLTAFATGQRHNDIYHRMRNVAAKLTPSEIKSLAIYYSGP